MRDEYNIPAITQRRLGEDEIRQEEREKIAQFLENIKEMRIPEMLRGIWREVDKDGFQKIDGEHKQLLGGAADAIRLGRHDEK